MTITIIMMRGILSRGKFKLNWHKNYPQTRFGFQLEDNVFHLEDTGFQLEDKRPYISKGLHRDF